MGTAKLPEELIEEMINAGAKVITCGKRKKDMLRNVIFQANSDAHKAYIKFCSKFDDDQSTIFDPVVTSVSPMEGDGVIPPLVDMGQIYLECNSCIIAYGRLKAHDFNPGKSLPALGRPSGLPGGGVVYSHTSISAHKLVERISRGYGCPTISKQPIGTILVKLNYFYANCLVTIAIPKQ